MILGAESLQITLKEYPHSRGGNSFALIVGKPYSLVELASI